MMELHMESKWGVYRLDIYNAPGWFLIQAYVDEQDADIYCHMLNLDTGLVHKVFEVDNE